MATIRVAHHSHRGRNASRNAAVLIATAAGQAVTPCAYQQSFVAYEHTHSPSVSAEDAAYVLEKTGRRAKLEWLSSGAEATIAAGTAAAENDSPQPENWDRTLKVLMRAYPHKLAGWQRGSESDALDHFVYSVFDQTNAKLAAAVPVLHEVFEGLDKYRKRYGPWIATRKAEKLVPDALQACQNCHEWFWQQEPPNFQPNDAAGRLGQRFWLAAGCVAPRERLLSAADDARMWEELFPDRKVTDLPEAAPRSLGSSPSPPIDLHPSALPQRPSIASSAC